MFQISVSNIAFAFEEHTSLDNLCCVCIFFEFPVKVYYAARIDRLLMDVQRMISPWRKIAGQKQTFSSDRMDQPSSIFVQQVARNIFFWNYMVTQRTMFQPIPGTGEKWFFYLDSFILAWIFSIVSFFLFLISRGVLKTLLEWTF